jgi:hypothetical protein
MHLRRLAGARSKRPFGAVQAPHQVPEVGTCFGPCAVDGNELGVVDQRLDHAVRVVSAPCLVEPQFNLANRIFICLSHDDLSRPCRAPRVARLSSPPPCRGPAGPCGRSGSLQGADTLVLAPCHSITRRRRAPASAAWWGSSAFAVLRLRSGLNWSAARPADRRALPLSALVDTGCGAPDIVGKVLPIRHQQTGRTTSAIKADVGSRCACAAAPISSRRLNSSNPVPNTASSARSWAILARPARGVPGRPDLGRPCRKSERLGSLVAAFFGGCGLSFFASCDRHHLHDLADYDSGALLALGSFGHDDI